jgi:hypothetical protein
VKRRFIRLWGILLVEDAAGAGLQGGFIPISVFIKSSLSESQKCPWEIPSRGEIQDVSSFLFTIN